MHNCRSDDLNADDLGGKADVLVCEIVDDQLIGDDRLIAELIAESIAELIAESIDETAYSRRRRARRDRRRAAATPHTGRRDRAEIGLSLRIRS